MKDGLSHLLLKLASSLKEDASEVRVQHFVAQTQFELSLLSCEMNVVNLYFTGESAVENV